MNLFKKKDWRSSKAHLLLLSKFLVARDLTTFRGNPGDHWEPVLGESPDQAIKRFRKDGVIEPAPLAEVLASSMTVAKLKPILQERGLPVKGKKADLIDRLIDADPVKARKLVAGKDMVICTEEGRTIAQAYVGQQKEDQQKAEQASFEAIRRGNFSAASKIVRRYEAAQVFPRGMGIDWNSDSPGEVAFLKILANITPKTLASLPEEEIIPLRHAACMITLWGVNRPKAAWLPAGFTNSSRLTNDWATLQFSSAAHTEAAITEYSQSKFGVIGIRIRTCNDDTVCAFCRSMEDKVIPLKKAKTLAPPFVQCTCEFGCRCFFSPELD